MPRLPHLNLKTLLTTTTIKSKPTPSLPLHLSITEPTTCIMDINPPTTPTSPARQLQFPNDTCPPRASAHQAPRSIVINISNLSTSSDPRSATDTQFAKLLAQTRGRRLGRKMSASRVRVASGSRQAWWGVEEGRKSSQSGPRPNSFFGLGFEMEIDELERIVEEVEGLSRRCREGERLGVEGEGRRVESAGERVGYVKL